MHAAVSLRGLLPPLAAVAAATILSASVPATAFAEPADDPVHPRTTTVNRTEGLDPEGDTVTVSGIGHSPGSRIEITTRAVPAEAARTDEADEAAVLDTENTVLAEVDHRGLFTVDLDTGVDFAADAGLDSGEDPFEIVLTEAEAAPDEDSGTAPEHGSWTEDAGTEEAAFDGGTAEAGVVSAGPGRSAPVLVPAAPQSAPVIGVVPVSFAAPAAQTPPQAQPPAVSAPQTQPQTQAAPQTVPRNPADLTLTVSKTSGLNPDGETVTVTGSGYDTSKGIYVALCDTAGAGATQAPSPCIGGVDMEGEGGASVWVSSNPPPYGEGLTTPYTGSGNNGGFTVELTVKGSDENTDCLSAATDCAVVTRNDHTRSSDRSQDKFVPVSFSGQTGDPGSSGGAGSGSGGSGGSGNGTSGSGGSGNAGGSGGSAGGSGGSGGNSPLATTGTALTGLVLTAAVVALTGAVAMFAARRRRGTDPADPAVPA